MVIQLVLVKKNIIKFPGGQMGFNQNYSMQNLGWNISFLTKELEAQLPSSYKFIVGNNDFLSLEFSGSYAILHFLTSSRGNLLLTNNNIGSSSLNFFTASYGLFENITSGNIILYNSGSIGTLTSSNQQTNNATIQSAIITTLSATAISCSSLFGSTINLVSGSFNTLSCSGDAIFAGGYRKDVGPWNISALLASQTNTRLNLVSLSNVSWVAKRSGSIIGLSIGLSINAAGSSASFVVYKNSTRLDGTNTVVGVGTSTKFISFEKDAFVFNPGDLLDVRYSTNISWTSVTAVGSVFLEVEE
jgi:hypothetical protein